MNGRCRKSEVSSVAVLGFKVALRIAILEEWFPQDLAFLIARYAAFPNYDIEKMD